MRNEILLTLACLVMILCVAVFMSKQSEPVDPVIHYLDSPRPTQPFDGPYFVPYAKPTTREASLPFRKLHLVRPDLILYPMSHEVYV